MTTTQTDERNARTKKAHDMIDQFKAAMREDFEAQTIKNMVDVAVAEMRDEEAARVYGASS
jgi:hypothetical protein